MQMQTPLFSKLGNWGWRKLVKVEFWKNSNAGDLIVETTDLVQPSCFYKERILNQEKGVTSLRVCCPATEAKAQHRRVY